MKRTKTGRFIAGLMSLLMVVTSVFAGDVLPVKAAGPHSINLQMSLADGVEANNYGFDYVVKDTTGTETDNKGYSSSVSLTDIPEGYSLEVKAITAGKQIWSGGSPISSEEQAAWEDGKTFTINSNIEYNFQLNNPPEGGQEPQGPGPGDIQINVNNGQNGKVEYKIGDGSWNEITNNNITLRKSNELSSVSNGASIYFKAEPNSEQSLDSHDKQNRVNDGNGDVQIPLDLLAAGTYAITYDNTKAYSMQIAFENGGGSGQQGPSAGDIQLNIKNNQNGKVSYKIGEGAWVEITDNNITLRKSNELSSVSYGASIYFKAEPNSEQSLDSHDKQNRVNDGNGDVQIPLDLLAAGTYAITYDDSKSYSMQIAFEGGSQGPGPDNAPKGILNFLCQDNKIIGGHISYKINGASGFSDVGENTEEQVYECVDLNNIELLNSFTIKLAPAETYHLDTDRGVTLYVNSNSRYYVRGDDANDFLGEDGHTFGLSSILHEGETVENSSFELEFGFLNENGGGTQNTNMLWVYSEQYGKDHNFVDPQGDVDCLVLNGDVDIIAIEYDGTTYSKDELLELGSKEDGQRGPVWYEVDSGNMGYAEIPAGAIVTVKLLPDYGYQVLRAELNGSEIAPTSEQSVFTFTMPTNNLHLSAVFTACGDEVVSSSGDIKSGAIQLGANEMNTGSALLTVEDSGNEQTFDETMDGLDGYEIASCLDIGLQQVFYKGTKSDYWANDKDTLASNATISLSLNDEIGTDVKILHEKHDGTVEILDATVENGTVTFKTSSFSTYAIVKTETSKKEKAGTTSQSQKNSKESNTDNTPVSTSHAGGSNILASSMLIRDINSTVAGNTLVVDPKYNRQFLTNAEMKALLKKGTIALRMQYNYNGVEYDITIPASLAANDEIPFYGPLYLASHFPATKIAEKANGNNLLVLADGKTTKGVVLGKYIVKRGDNLYKIARKFGTTLSDVVQKNPQISNINRIYPGQLINI